LFHGVTLRQFRNGKFRGSSKFFDERTRGGGPVIVNYPNGKIDVLGPHAADACDILQNNAKENEQKERQDQNPEYLLPDPKKHPRIGQIHLKNAFHEPLADNLLSSGRISPIIPYRPAGFTIILKSGA
jgi:hypothetical protein